MDIIVKTFFVLVILYPSFPALTLELVSGTFQDLAFLLLEPGTTSHLPVTGDSGKDRLIVF